MSFRFHTYLNPQSVAGVMLRLRQASWLDSFDDIVCDEHEDMWEVRKRFPKVAYRVRYVHDGNDPVEGEIRRQLYVVNESGRSFNWHEEDVWATVDPTVTLRLEDLAPVTAITSDYA
jgi:hypothetical protein